MIPEGWKTYKLGELGSFFGGVTSIKPDDYDHGTPFLTYKNVYKNSKVDIHELELMNVSHSDVEKRNCIFGDIFFTASSETPDEVAMSSVLLDNVPNLTFNGFCKRLRLNNFKTLSPEYARYLFRDRSFRQKIYQLATGDIRFNISQNSLASIEINIPDLETQIHTSSFLTSLDDKIELNLQMNKTLESIAQAIFKEWFVDFRFPGFDGELVEGLPKGWRKSTIRNIADKVQYGYTQSSSSEEIGPKFLRITDIQNGVVDWSHVPYCTIDSKEFDKYKIKNHDIFIARTGASTGENIYIIEPPSSVFASYLIRIQFNKPEYAFYIGKFLRNKKYFNYISSSLGGSAQPNANAKTLTNIEVVVPENKTLMNYFDLTFPFHLRIVKNQKENQTLKQLRDILLPKLMTDKIRVA